MLRGLRGAVTAAADTPPSIREATRALLAALIEANGLTPEDVVSAIFTATPDLRAEFPAAAARELGWHSVPLLDAVEIDKPGALPRCIRVLIHAEMPPDRRPVHVYLGEAAALRPDLAGGANPRTLPPGGGESLSPCGITAGEEPALG